VTTSGSLRLFTIDLDQPDAAVPALAGTLDRDEQRAAAARATGPPRHRYVVAHGALREVLGAALGRDPAAIRFDRRCRHCGDPAHGKPAVVDAGECSFSLSHSGGLAVVAIAIGRGEVGVDVEMRRDRRHLDRLAARVFATEPLAEWHALPAAARLDAFLRAWTIKEAFGKATGHGLVRPRAEPVSPEGWTLVNPTATPGAVVGLAVEGAADLDPVATWEPATGVSLGGAW
jgi:4'-phosphopantetheinyl transferase